MAQNLFSLAVPLLLGRFGAIDVAKVAYLLGYEDSKSF